MAVQVGTDRAESVPGDPRLAAGAALVDGQLVPIAEARIPLTDRSEEHTSELQSH